MPECYAAGNELKSGGYMRNRWHRLSVPVGVVPRRVDALFRALQDDTRESDARVRGW